MGKKGRANKSNTAVVKTVEQEVPKEEPVPEPPKEPEMSLGEKKLQKQREKEQREEQERLKREALAAQLQKQENKAHAKKSKSKTQKIKLDRNFSESSQQSSPEKVVQDKVQKVPSGQIEKITLKEEIRVKQEPEPIQSSQQNVYRDEPSIDSGLSGNTTMKNDPDDWANDTDEHCNQYNTGPSNTDSDAFFSDNRYQNRDNQGSDQWKNTYYNRNRQQPNRDGSTSNFQQERSGYRGSYKNPRGSTGYHNDNKTSRGGTGYQNDTRPPRGGSGYPNDNKTSRGGTGYQNDTRPPRGGSGYHNDNKTSRGGTDYPNDNRTSRGSTNYPNDNRTSRGGTGYHNDTRPPRGGTDSRNDNRGSYRGNEYRGNSFKQTRGFSNSLRPSDRGGDSRDNRSRNSQNWNNRSQSQQYDNKPSKTECWEDPYKPKQENWGETVQVDDWEQPQATTESQESFPAATQDTFNYAQANSSGYMGTQSYHNTAGSDYPVQSDDSRLESTPDQSPLNTSAGDHDLKSDFPELPQSQGKFNQSDDQKMTSRNQSGEASRWDSDKTRRPTYNNHRDRNQTYEQNSGNYSTDKKRKNESFNSSYNSSHNKHDSYGNYNKYSTVERNDMEFRKFQKLSRQDRPINNGKLREETGDLFLAPVEYSLAHCVAEDMSMGAGIAKTFRLKFGRVPQLLDQDARTGGLAVLEDGDRFLYYLVTKERSQGKPTLYTLWLSLNKLKDHCQQHGVTKLAIPQIGCGLDRLRWPEVKQLLEYVFRDVDIEIVVYTLEGDVEDRRVKKCYINHQKLSLNDIETGTGHIYFGYCDGTVTEDITSLSTKFNILTAYKSGRKEIGDVIRTEGKTQQDDVIYGVIIKQTPNEKLSFTKLDRALRNLSKYVKKDEYNYVGFQAFVDENDEQIIDKITTIMQYALKDVEIWVCWPKEIEKHCPVQPNRD